MNASRLTIGLNPSPYTQALFDGSVRPEGIGLQLQSRFGEGLDNVTARLLPEKLTAVSFPFRPLS